MYPRDRADLVARWRSPARTAASPGTARSRNSRCPPSRAAKRRSRACRVAGTVPGLQPHSVRAIEHPGLRHDSHGASPPVRPLSARRQTGQYRLQMRFAQPAARSKAPVQRRPGGIARRARQGSGRARTSTRLFAAATRFHSPAVSTAEATGLDHHLVAATRGKLHVK